MTRKGKEGRPMTRKAGKKGNAINKPSMDGHDYPLRYLMEHNGGSLRHNNTRIVDVMKAMFDLGRDWDKYAKANVLALSDRVKKTAKDGLSEGGLEHRQALIEILNICNESQTLD